MRGQLLGSTGRTATTCLRRWEMEPDNCRVSPGEQNRISFVIGSTFARRLLVFEMNQHFIDRPAPVFIRHVFEGFRHHAPNAVQAIAAVAPTGSPPGFGPKGGPIRAPRRRLNTPRIRSCVAAQTLSRMVPALADVALSIYQALLSFEDTPMSGGRAPLSIDNGSPLKAASAAIVVKSSMNHDKMARRGGGELMAIHPQRSNR